MFSVGIDGGGTHTRVAIVDERGEIVSRSTFGPFNISAIGEVNCRNRLREVFGSIGKMSDCRSVCIGGAGVSSDRLGGIIREELAAVGFAGKLRLCADFVIAKRGAMAGPGAILICGTGSVAYGVTGGGEELRVGGYGHLVDDGGSGYAIGRDGLMKTIRMLDGRLEKTGLADAVLAEIGGTGIQSILDYVYYSGRDKSAVAALTKSVLKCAEDGDPVAMDILKTECEELALIVSAVSRKMGGERFRLSLFGGLLENDTVYRRITEERLSAYAEIIKPEHDALYGAAKLAYEACD